jgi:hypothetical protein
LKGRSEQGLPVNIAMIMEKRAVKKTPEGLLGPDVCEEWRSRPQPEKKPV